MLFNSLNFAIFLPVVFILYWFVANKSLKFQNILLLISSYFFYACWDWRFLFLLIFSTMLDYFSGIKIAESNNLKARNFWFWLSISINLGFLGVFKYYNFFIESFAAGVANFGLTINPLILDVLLPVGISFYTFHGLSYVIDIYKGRIKAEKNLVDYSVFVSFFPLLVAGPIERATHLLPQIKKERFFDYSKAVDGLRQILWGLFKKVVIADQCAQYANDIFNNSAEYPGSTLVLGAIFFAFQIYGDFSGYSDIAIGTARLFGIDLLRNFAFPYFSRDIAEFWRRWHISLSTWFRDYLYIPLGGSKGGTWMKIRNTFIIFLVSGFWHGANWTFIVWGFLHALYIMPSVIFKTNRKNLDVVAQNRFVPTLKEILQMSLTFSLVAFAWIFFRANNLEHALAYISEIFSKSLFTYPKYYKIDSKKVLFMILFLFILVEWIGRKNEFAIEKIGCKTPKLLRWCFYYLIIFAIFNFLGKEQQFIYFQF
ncbi:MBOAT family O-acyltransferase [Flavobacterium sp.]|uniref:MBOAT family O-acyltransferase n=1 Tax=Flavobacterium sp. TaxID=239 RepID=UPI002ED782AD